jgi:microcompartment protein CcmL/EutN
MMKKVPALALLDFAEIPPGVDAVDALLKKAPIAFVRAGTVTHGRYLVLFGGSTGATAEALSAAVAVGGASLLDQAFLPDVHPAVFDAVFGIKKKPSGSLLILETETAASLVRAVEAAVKGTSVGLVELRLSDSGLSGKAIALLSGSLPDVEEAARLATGALGNPPRGLTHRLIAAPHEALERGIAAATRFADAPLLELDGEKG